MRTLWIAIVFSLAACQPAPVGVRNIELEPTSGQKCVDVCRRIGLGLDSVVVMANNVGCVCRAESPPPAGAPPATTPPTSGGSGAAGGMAAIMMQMQAATAQKQQQRLQQQQQQQQQHY